MSIANKLSYLNETREKILTNLQALGRDLTDESTFRSYADEIDDMWEEQPHATGEGETLSLDNTKKGRMKVGLAGNTYQDSTTGKNILGFNDIASTTKSGMTYSVSNNVLYLNGTTTSSFFINDIFKVLGQMTGDYTMSFRISNIPASKLSCGIRNSSNTNILGGEIGESKVYTRNINDTMTTSFVYINSGVTITNGTVEIQVETGTTKTDFEPFTNGAAPNPDYPMEIHNVTGDNTVTVRNKNYFDMSVVSTYGITEKLATGFKFTNNLNGGGRFASSFAVSLPTGTSYRLISTFTSSENVGGDIRIEISYADGTKGYVSANSSNIYFGNASKTITSIRFYFQSGVANNEWAKYENVMIVRNDESDLSYEPHKGTTYSINLPVENIFNKDITPFSYGATINVGEDYIKITRIVGTTTTCYASYEISVEQNTNYYLSLKALVQNSDLEGSSSIVIRTGASGGTVIKTQNLSISTTTEQDLGFTFNSGANSTLYVWFYTDSKAGETSSTGTRVITYKNIQVEKGSHASQYAPYGTEPIVLSGIDSYLDGFVRSTGKNYFTDEKATRRTKLSYSNYIYTASDGDDRGSLQYKVQQYREDETYITGTQNTKTISNVGKYFFTDTKTSETKYIRIANNGSHQEFGLFYPLDDIEVGEQFTVVLDVIDKTVGASKFGFVMLLKGEVSQAEFEPYGNDEWYLKKDIGKTQVSLGNTLYDIGTYKGLVFTTNIPKVSQSLGISYCSKSLKTSSSSQRVDGRYYENPLNYVFIGSSTDTVEAIKSKFNGSDFYYPLATPTYTKLTYQPLVEQLEAVWRAVSFDGQTNVSQINNDMPFEISAKALSDGTVNTLSLNSLNTMQLTPSLNIQNVQPTVEEQQEESVEQEETEEPTEEESEER